MSRHFARPSAQALRTLSLVNNAGVTVVTSLPHSHRPAAPPAHCADLERPQPCQEQGILYK